MNSGPASCTTVFTHGIAVSTSVPLSSSVKTTPVTVMYSTPAPRRKSSRGVSAVRHVKAPASSSAAAIRLLSMVK